MNRAMRFGCVAIEPPASRDAWRERVLAIDGWGYDTLLLPDHVGFWPPFAPIVAAAAWSDRLRFGTQVLNLEFWNPLLLAREAAAVDVLTDGRLELGLGAGHAEVEFRAAGLRYPPAGERVHHLGELVPIVRRLLTGETLDHTGAYDLASASTGFAAAQDRVPLMVGGNGDRVLRIAAESADIVGLVGFNSGRGQVHTDLSHFTWEGLADRVALVARHAGERFGDLELSILIQSVVLTSERPRVAERIAARFSQPVELVLDSPFLFLGSAAELTDQAARLRDELGVTYLTTMEPGAAGLAEVIPRLR
jgi:probable F420-dependent oxidoreductase